MAGNENSGRDSNAEIIRKYVDTELANKIANKELKRIDENGGNLEEMKAIVMPVALKGMVNKSEATVNVIKMDESILDKYVAPQSAENYSEGQA
jgi:hypothetical protein